jgi:phage terminase small subunit
MSKPRRPPGLSPEAQLLWDRTIASWPVGKEQTLLTMLRSACGALMRLRSAEEELIRFGSPIFNDRWGQPRQNPLCGVIRDSAKQLRDDLRALSLDWESLNRAEATDGDDDQDGGL